MATQAEPGRDVHVEVDVHADADADADVDANVDVDVSVTPKMMPEYDTRPRPDFAAGPDRPPRPPPPGTARPARH